MTWDIKHSSNKCWYNGKSTMDIKEVCIYKGFSTECIKIQCPIKITDKVKETMTEDSIGKKRKKYIDKFKESINNWTVLLTTSLPVDKKKYDSYLKQVQATREELEEINEVVVKYFPDKEWEQTVKEVRVCGLCGHEPSNQHYHWCIDSYED